jgi:hypothetical protein
MNMLCIKITVGNGPRAVPPELLHDVNIPTKNNGTPQGAFPTDNRFWYFNKQNIIAQFIHFMN